METGLQTMARNLNHRNDNLKLFEFGKTYLKSGDRYFEEDHLAIFTSGIIAGKSWNSGEAQADLFYLKGILQSLAKLSGIEDLRFSVTTSDRFTYALTGSVGKKKLITLGKPSAETLKKFDIRNPVWYADINWNAWLQAASSHQTRYREISRFPAVARDLSFLTDRQLTYAELEKTIQGLKIPHLKSFSIFDIFKSDKLGKDKQSIAMNFTFQDVTKTMTDTEVDEMMAKITAGITQNHGAEIRK
jgi:phenylalanyl-tRNA synthetase beta chain